MAKGIILASALSMSALVLGQTQTRAQAYEAVTQNQYGRVCSAVSKGLNQRTGAGVRHSMVSAIPNGNKIGILASSNNDAWLYVNHKGRFGWVNKYNVCS